MCNSSKSPGQSWLTVGKDVSTWIRGQFAGNPCMATDLGRCSPGRAHPWTAKSWNIFAPDMQAPPRGSRTIPSFARSSTRCSPAPTAAQSPMKACRRCWAPRCGRRCRSRRTSADWTSLLSAFPWISASPTVPGRGLGRARCALSSGSGPIITCTASPRWPRSRLPMSEMCRSPAASAWKPATRISRPSTPRWSQRAWCR